VKLKPSTVAPQSRFLVLSEQNFEELVRRTFVQAQIRQKLAADLVKIPLVVYISETPSARVSSGGATGLRRATTGRIQEAQAKSRPRYEKTLLTFQKQRELARFR
jgi:hypothetical protein